MIFLLCNKKTLPKSSKIIEYKGCIIFTLFEYNEDITILDLTHIESSIEYMYFIRINKNNIIPLFKNYFDGMKNVIILTKTNNEFLQKLFTYYEITPSTTFNTIKNILNYVRRINALLFCESIKNKECIIGDTFFNLKRNIIEFL